MRFVATLRTILIAMSAVSCFGQTLPLGNYLSLTSQQVAAIQKANADFFAYIAAQSTQLGSLISQLNTLYSNPSLDAFSIGMRYVSIESINRDEAQHLAALQAQVVAQLTPDQKLLLPALSSSIASQQLVYDVQCAFLADIAPRVSFVDPNVSQEPSLRAFIPPAPSGVFCGSAQFPLDVRDYFSIADSQVSAFFAARVAYVDYYARQQNRIADVQVQIRDETAKPSPDPTVLGMYYVQLAQVGLDIRNQASALSKSAGSVLTAEQNAKLTALQGAANLLQPALQAVQCHLMPFPPATGVSGASSVPGQNACGL